MHRLSYSFVLGYHGCDRKIGEELLAGKPFRPSRNDYDWLGEGVYFWEANPRRGLEFARETLKREPKKVKEPFVIGAVIDLGVCLDLTTADGLALVKRGHESLKRNVYESLDLPLPRNSPDGLRRPLDCAVLNWVHSMRKEERRPRFDSVRGVFTEGGAAYEGAGFPEKTHIQIAVRNLDCIKGVFRVPNAHINPV